MKKKHSKYFERIRNKPNSGSWRKKEIVEEEMEQDLEK